MGFLTPITALIAAGITVPLLVAMYFLKLRRRKVVVASTLLWRKAIQDMQVNSPFQKMRKNLLLWIQLLLLAALLIALARPTQRTMAQPGRQVVIVIDHSGSMNAKDAGGDTRLDEAKARALELVDAAADSANGTTGGASGGAMVVSFAERAQVIQPFTNDPTLLRSAIRSIQPTDQRSNIAEALRLVEPFALRGETSDEEKLTVHVFSDGRVHGASDDLSLRGAELKYKLIGSDQAQTHANNLAIVSLAARRDFDKPQRVQVFARLTNYSNEQVNANLTLSIDGIPTRVSPVRVPPAAKSNRLADGTIAVGEPGSLSVPFEIVMTDAALVELRHDHKDLLAADDAAWLTIAPARRLRVLLVTRGNAFLDRVIRSAKVRDLVLMSPDKYEDQDPALLRRGGWDATGFGGAGEGFDVIVFDDYTPKQTPLVNSLYLGSAPPIEGLELKPAAESDQPTQVILNWARDHGLMRYVVLDDVVLSRPGRIVVPVGGDILATGQHGPLIAELKVDGVHHVMTSFGILQSNWPLYVSFPVFVSNSLQVLGLGALADQAGVSQPVGQPIVVRVDGVDGGLESGETLRYSGPVAVSAKVSQGRAILPPMMRVGVYETKDAVEPPDDRLAVNLLDVVESDLRVADRLEVGAIDAEGEAAVASIRIEVWHWFAWAALGVLMIEWVVYTRRMHL